MGRRLRIAVSGTARPLKREFAEMLRKLPTRAERILWRALRDKQLGGYVFRRQRVIAGFIVDFYCARARLVVEVDGRYHDAPAQRRRDARRTATLERVGVRVLRIPNEAIFTDLDRVLRTIAEACGGESAVRYGHSPKQRWTAIGMQQGPAGMQRGRRAEAFTPPVTHRLLRSTRAPAPRARPATTLTKDLSSSSLTGLDPP